jgi:TetR/AcrR family transcriptional regulator, transcriptional repressor for nem operon
MCGMPAQIATATKEAPRGAHRTYEALLDAGLVVASRDGLAGLSVNRVVAEAGVAKGTFYVHFADREAFVDALHARFHERVAQAVAVASTGTSPGAERIVRGVEAYLDVCLADRAIKALALEARTESTLTASMAVRHERAAAAAIPSFKAMGWPDPKAAAQLLAAMTAELAVRELDAGRRLPGARRALRRFVGVIEPERPRDRAARPSGKRRRRA